MSRVLFAALFLSLAGVAAHAQTAVPPGQGDPFKDTSMFKPPAGAKVAIIEWEDLECPACAHAFPIVHTAIAHYKIPLVRRDFQIPGHIWSHDASIWARYLEDKVSPQTAEDFRRVVFAGQIQIASKDDLQRVITKFFADHKLQMPFVIDPAGQFAKEVEADKNLGLKMGLEHTPTIIVATNKSWVQVVDVNQLYSVIDAALAQTGGPAAATAPAKKPAVTTTTAHKKTS
jgi:protein-disulfide isomerase